MSTVSTKQMIPHFLQREADNTIYLDTYVDSTRTQVDVGATVSIYDGNGTAIVTDGGVTEGLPSSYTISAATLPGTLAFSDDWVVEWTFEIGGVEFVIREDAHLVLRKIYPVVQESTLLKRHFDLAELLPADKSSWQDEIDEAWAMIVGELISQDQFPYLVMNPWVFRKTHMFLSLSIIFLEISTHAGGSGRYADLADKYDDKAWNAWDKIALKYDVNQTGLAGDANAHAQAQPVVMLTGSNRSKGHWRRF